MDFLPASLSPLGDYAQFIVYKLVESKKRLGKIDKIPVHFSSGVITNPLDRVSWTTIENALSSAKKFGENYGVGFVFTEKDPFWFLDIDNCYDADTGRWSELSTTLLNAFPDAAVEVSSSGNGLHVIGSGTVPEHACKNAVNNIEFYDKQRFVALTGYHARGSAGIDFTPSVTWLVQNYFSKKESQKKSDSNWTTEPYEGWGGCVDDHELISRALNSKSARSAFSGRGSFRDLWEKNVEVLQSTYPDDTRENGYNESSADAALAMHLAFWTGNNCERIKKLMFESALVREKWKRDKYVRDTILYACSQQKERLCKEPQNMDKDKDEKSVLYIDTKHVDSVQPEMRQGNTFLSIDQQIELFKGCVYVCDEHTILIPGGYSLNQDRFRVMYGGYSMPIDSSNQKVSKNAWEVFTESQAVRFPKVASTCFRPDLKPAEIIRRDGKLYVNSWWPIETPRAKGDATPFLNHLKLLCPDTQDFKILLCYLAALIQHKGIKFQWCPVIQGVEGNGKTLLTRCVAFAIGQEYSHFPRASEISNKFNHWLYRKIFIGVEDIYVSNSRLEIMEALKPMITGERQEVEPKKKDQQNRDICANFLINTNHKDGLRKIKSDRRFAHFFTPQQTIEDLDRDGMNSEYFTKLYRWLNKENGFAIVSELLHTYEIADEFNPALGNRAPITSSTGAAINYGLGGIEQEVQEAIDQGVIGFRNGWVSSMALDRLLDKMHATRRIPNNRRRELMTALDYDWHPNLKDGRVNNTIILDNGKPRLYIKKGHPSIELKSAAEIAKAYEAAQKLVD